VSREAPSISVVVCTLRRPAYLRKALAGLAEQTIGTERYEVLVIDNGPDAETAQVVSEFAGAPMPPRYLAEPNRGLSHARNRGWREARGMFVAYLDDDAVPDRAWLAQACAVLDEGDARLGMLGGQVVPIWEAARPAWLPEGLLGYLTMVDLGPGRMLVDSLSGIVGANMIVPRRLLEQLGGFSPRLGRKGRSLLSNEELLLKQQLSEAGHHAIYSAAVRVGHHVPRERLSRRWFMRRLYWQGRSDALVQQIERPRSLPVRAVAAGRMGREAFRWLWRWLAAGPRTPGKFELLTTSLYNLGYAVGELSGSDADGSRGGDRS
jgi:glucosyl-dolichyl phosphate glucuronosyltransferase